MKWVAAMLEELTVIEFTANFEVTVTFVQWSVPDLLTDTWWEWIFIG